MSPRSKFSRSGTILPGPACRLLLALALLGLCGCTAFRGIPSHGGGKRFSEEQRIVAGAIRQAVADMDLSALRGKSINIVSQNLATSGVGNVTWGGLQDIGVNASYSISGTEERTDRYLREADDDEWYPFEDVDQVRDSSGLSGSLRYRPYISYFSHNSNSEQDVRYLMSVLEMKCRHEGITINPQKPQVLLYLLVDQLGVNRSRLDMLLAKRDRYQAECALTWYAQDLKTGKLSIPEQRSRALASYLETFLLFIGYHWQEREIQSLEPLEFRAIAHNGFHPSAAGGFPTAGSANTPSPEDIQAGKDSYMNLLAERTRVLLEAGQLDEAGENLERMRGVDPNHTELNALEVLYSDEVEAASEE